MADVTEDPVAKLLQELGPLELLSILPMDKASHIAGEASPDTLERAHPDKIVELSPRRRGMRLIHALMIRKG